MLTRFALLLALACGSSTTPLEARVLTVGCGMCQFGETDFPGCYWAAEIDGRVVPLVGDGLPPDHDAHGPEGMCTLKRQAEVTGVLEAERVVVSEMTLLPVGPDDVDAATPHHHAH